MNDEIQNVVRVIALKNNIKPVLIEFLVSV